MQARSLFLPVALLLCAGTSAASAADGDITVNRAMLRPSASTEKEVSLGVGIGPSYLGGKLNSLYVGLDAELNFGNGVFFSRDGLGYRFLETPSGLSMAASIGASGSRRERDNRDGNRFNRLQGMGDIDAKLQANVFLNYDNGPFHVNTAVHQTLAQRRGTGVDVSAGYDLLAEHDDLVRADVGMSYANRSLMQTFFGVDRAQSVNTGYNVYTPHAGIAGAAASVSWRHAFNRNWTGAIDIGVVKLRGPAADSPLTERATSPVASAMVGYRF
jgi:outer membrane scaffolding protein for murein synthesis (MipA/OmpV family)